MQDAPWGRPLRLRGCRLGTGSALSVPSASVGFGLGIKDLPDFLTETTMMTSGCDTWAPLALLMTLGSVVRWRDDCSNSGGQPCPRPPVRRPEAWNAPASLEAEGQVNNGTVGCVPGRGPSF